MIFLKSLNSMLNVETSYLSNMLKHKPSNVFIQQTYLFRLKISSKEK